jgi:two-component system cell cycle sensor histidine kinase/response regulator CckA
MQLIMARKNGPPKPPILSREPPAAHAVERRLAQNEDGFRLLFMNNPQPMWVFDAETTRFLEVNSAAVEHYGYSRQEFLTMRITEIRPPEDVPRLLADAAKARSGLRNAGTWKHRLKDGRLIDVEISSDHLTFAGQNAVLVVVRDITEQKKAEQALQETERRYRSMVEDAVIGIFQSTPQGRFLTVNPTLAAMLGYESPQDLLASVNDLQCQVYVDPKRREEFTRALEQQGIVRNFESEVYCKDGSKVWISANARTVRENGVVVRYEGMNEDVTKRKLLEEQLLQSQKMEAVGLLAGGVAHDFNNALSVITGYSGLLQMRLPADDPLVRYAEEIAKAAHRAAGLTRQLLAFSRKQVIQPVILDLNSLIVEMEKMLRRLIGENIQIFITCDASLARVKVDASQMEQILMNLAVNARDAMLQGGKVTIRTANADLDETYSLEHFHFKPGRYVILSFSDTGCGMDKETVARIFEPFFTTKEPGKGTGLGLSTVYGIVKQNGGYISAYSEPGQGTTFKIYLPQAEGMVGSAPTVLPAEILPRGSETILTGRGRRGAAHPGAELSGEPGLLRARGRRWQSRDRDRRETFRPDRAPADRRHHARHERAPPGGSTDRIAPGNQGALPVGLRQRPNCAIRRARSGDSASGKAVYPARAAHQGAASPRDLSQSASRGGIVGFRGRGEPSASHSTSARYRSCNDKEGR